MWRSTKRTLFWLGMNLALLPLSAGCTETRSDDTTGGSAGSSTTATAGSGGSGGSGGDPGGGGEAGAAPACDTPLPAESAAFAPANGPYGGLFTHVAATPNVIVAAAGYGFHRSMDDGDTWEPITAPALEGQKPLAIAAVGDDLFVVVPNMVYRSTDGGESWQEACTAECFYPSYMSARGAELYVLDGGIPFRWDAAAAAWEGLPPDDPNLRFDVVESDGQSLYANSLYTPGAYRLDLADVAAGWAPAPGLTEWGYRAFAFTGSHGFVANANQLFRTEDGGATWSANEVTPGAAVNIYDLFVSGDTVFAASASGLWTSADQGATWKESATGAYASAYTFAAGQAHLFVAQKGLRRRATSGGEWQDLPVMADQIGSLRATQSAVISSSTMGVFRTADGGGSWSPVSLPEGQYYSGASLAHFGGKLFAPSGDKLLVSDDDGASFSTASFDLAVDGYVRFVVAVDQGLVAGVLRSAGSPCPGAQSLATTLYLSKDGVTWTSALNGFPATFTDCYGKDHPPAVTSLVQQGDMLVAGTYVDGIFYSDDQGATWHASSTGGDVGSLVELMVAGDVVLAAGHGVPGMWRSEDGGKSWQKSGLDGVVVQSMLSAGDSAFAGGGGFGDGKGGVFHSPDRGVTWTPIDASFSTMVTHLAIQGDTLFAGTSTRSVWVAPLTCAPAP